jgi:hypothetical protein
MSARGFVGWRSPFDGAPGPAREAQRYLCLEGDRFGAMISAVGLAVP